MIGPLLREAGFVADEADPEKVTATFDASGRPRSVSATYANGWRARLTLRKDGSYALSQSITLTSKARR